MVRMSPQRGTGARSPDGSPRDGRSPRRASETRASRQRSIALSRRRRSSHGGLRAAHFGERCRAAASSSERVDERGFGAAHGESTMAAGVRIARRGSRAIEPDASARIAERRGAIRCRALAKPRTPPHCATIRRLRDSPMALLEIQNVTRRFGDFTAVDGVSLAIEAGEFFTLLGPSGCGKTTLLRMIAGFDLPDGGSILLNGTDLADRPPEERPVRTVFQSYALFPHMTVEGNVAFPLKMAKTPPARDPGQDRRGARGRPPRRASASAIRTSSPAGRSSASRSRARWSPIRRCCCSTSRSPRSTPSCARRCRSSSSTCRRRSASRSST